MSTGDLANPIVMERSIRKPLKQLALFHLIGNAALLGLGYYWLGVGESDALHLTLSIALLAIFLVGAVWLHGASLLYFQGPKQNIGSLLWSLRGQLLPLLLLAIATAILYFWLDGWSPEGSSQAVTLASWFTLKLQSPVSPATVAVWLSIPWWLLRWCVLPMLLLPMASGIAVRGWSGLSEVASQLGNWRAWIAVPALLTLAVIVPLWLIQWTPLMGGFGREMASLIVRMLAGYLLFVAGCFALAFVISRGKPVVSQPSTSVSE